MIISMYETKTFVKIHCPFIIKAPKKTALEGSYINKLKVICDKPIANIILNGENMKEL
jgi:hypothetical protein